MTKDNEHRREVINKLEPYLELEGSDLGEAGQAIIFLLRVDYCISDEMWESLMKEAEDMLKTFEEDFEIVEEEYTVTRKSRELREKI